ncbi:MAG: hypothetical protein Fur0032_07240 [Terrimicrobiaceae bacterium]
MQQAFCDSNISLTYLAGNCDSYSSKPDLMKSHTTSTQLLVGGLILAAAAYRVLSATLLSGLPNFSPVMAMAFCGGIFLTGLSAWVVPLGALFFSDVLLAVALGFPLMSGGALAAWFCTLAAVALGRWMSGRSKGFFPILGGLAGSSLLFYLVTNSASWLANPAYAKSWGGLIQSLTVGLPGYPPTWMFFRNSLISDLVFGAAIFMVWALASRSAQTAYAEARA